MVVVVLDPAQLALLVCTSIDGAKFTSANSQVHNKFSEHEICSSSFSIFIYRYKKILCQNF